MAGGKDLFLDTNLNVYREDLVAPSEADAKSALQECLICRNIPKESPYACSGCFKYTCKNCTLGLLNDKCSHCQKIIRNARDFLSEASSISSSALEENGGVEYQVVKDWGSRLAKLKIFCNSEECVWTAQYQEGVYEQHKRECPYIEIDCPNGCGASYQRQDQDSHNESCANALNACEHCQKKMSLEQLGSHVQGCGLAKVVHMLGEIKLNDDLKHVLQIQNQTLLSLQQKVERLTDEKYEMAKERQALQNQCHQLSAKVKSLTLHNVLDAVLEIPVDVPMTPPVAGTYFSEPFSIDKLRGGDKYFLALVLENENSRQPNAGRSVKVFLVTPPGWQRQIESPTPIPVEIVLLNPNREQDNVVHKFNIDFRQARDFDGRGRKSLANWQILSDRRLLVDYGSRNRVHFGLRYPDDLSQQLRMQGARHSEILESRYVLSPIVASQNKVTLLVKPDDLVEGARRKYTVTHDTGDICISVSKNAENSRLGVHYKACNSAHPLPFIAKAWGRDLNSPNLQYHHFLDINVPEHTGFSSGESYWAPFARNGYLELLITFHHPQPTATPIDVAVKGNGHRSGDIDVRPVAMDLDDARQQVNTRMSREHASRVDGMSTILNMFPDKKLERSMTQMERLNDHEFIWKLPMMEAMHKSAGNDYKSRQFTMGRCNYFVSLSRSNSSEDFGIFLHADCPWYNKSQPENLESIVIKLSGAQELTYTMNIPPARRFRASAEWNSIVRSGRGWRNRVTRGLCRDDGSLDIKVTINRSRVTNIEDGERQPLLDPVVD